MELFLHDTTKQEDLNKGYPPRKIKHSDKVAARIRQYSVSVTRLLQEFTFSYSSVMGGLPITYAIYAVPKVLM